MADDEQRLLVSFEARLTKYERDLDRAKNKSRTNFKAIQKEAEEAGSGIEKAMGSAMGTLGSFGKGLVGGVVGGLAVGGIDEILGRVRELAKSVAEVGDQAKMTGMKTKDFQELAYVAEQNRIPVDALADGMKELSLRADEWIKTGQGSGAESFQRLGYSASDLAKKLEDPKELLLDIIDRMQDLDRAARIRVFDELFGGQGGEKFVQLIDRGADGIRKTIKEANELGVIMSDQLIQRADEFNQKWDAIGRTISTSVKEAVLGLAFAADGFLDRFNKVEEQATGNVQKALIAKYKDLDEAKKKLADLMQDQANNPDDPFAAQNIERQQQVIADLTKEALKLRDVLDRRSGYSDTFVYKTGEEAKGATPLLAALNAALANTDTSTRSAINAMKSYADAIRALKQEVPDLAKQLAELDAKNKIEAIYQKAVSMANGPADVYMAHEIRGKALDALNLKSATDDPESYLSSILATGKGASSITGMQSAFQQKLAKMVASMPADLRGTVTINSGFRDIQRQQELWLEALKKYGSPEVARKWVAPPGNSQHNKGNAADLGFANDSARQWVHENAGNFGLSFPLSNENWHIEDSAARSKETTAEIEKLTQAAQKQSEAYRRITSSARTYIDEQQTERQALGMTADKAKALRLEHQLLAQAQRSGITLTAENRQEIARLAEGMAIADTSLEQYRERQEQAQETAHFFGQTMTDALTGIISGTETAQQAMQQLLQAMLKATLQALLMGEGPLANLFGTAPKKNASGNSVGFGGLFGSLLGGLFGFSDGGYTGPGAVDEPRGVVHAGEVVWSQRDVARAGGPAVVDAMRLGRRGYADGGVVDGYAGTAPTLRTPDVMAANGNAASNQQINITAPITVNANGGTPEQNNDLAKRMSKQLEQSMRGVVADEIRKQTRPGNFLNTRSR